MKQLSKHIIFFVCITFIQLSFSQKNTKQGYQIENDTLVFVFNVNDYNNIKDLNIPIHSVAVSGVFNNWSKYSWPMQKLNDSIFKLKSPIYMFDNDNAWEFKFYVNENYWAEPNSDFKNIVEAFSFEGYKYGTYNLKVYKASVSENGNITFRLKGYKDAENVVLSGSFNKWNEHLFKMKRNDYGWSITLNIKPGIYEYKFIIDGEWITDPNNPSKVYNEFGGQNSVVDINKRVLFKLSGYENAKKVILSGNFNDWDESMYSMKKINNSWEFSTYLSYGKYHYKFIVDGNWITDPNNSVKEYDDYGNINSVYFVR